MILVKLENPIEIPHQFDSQIGLGAEPETARLAHAREQEGTRTEIQGLKTIDVAGEATAVVKRHDEYVLAPKTPYLLPVEMYGILHVLRLEDEFPVF